MSCDWDLECGSMEITLTNQLLVCSDQRENMHKGQRSRSFKEIIFSRIIINLHL